jgi:hypothetical protein
MKFPHPEPARNVLHVFEMLQCICGKSKITSVNVVEIGAS